MATVPALSAAETRAAEALLDRVWGRGASVHAAEPIWDRSHVVRLHLATGRSVVMKKRADEDSFGMEVAALEYLNGMPEPVAPRLRSCIFMRWLECHLRWRRLSIQPRRCYSGRA